MQQRRTLPGSIASLASGFFVVHYFSLLLIRYQSWTSRFSSSGINLGIIDQYHRSLRRSPYVDPKTVTLRAPSDEADFNDPSIVLDQQDTRFIVPIAHLAASKYAEPTVVLSRPVDPGYTGIVVDVLSIGSNTRLELVSSHYDSLLLALL